MTAVELKSKRMGAGLSGDLVCRALGISRGTLSMIEAGYRPRTEEEFLRMNAVLDQLISAKGTLATLAVEMGLSFSGPLALGIKAGRF